MHPTGKMARVAGLLYLLMTIPGVFSVIYVPGKLIAPGNAAVTSNNILAHETLFRLGIVSELISAVVFIFLVTVLYRLFKAVDRTQASLMVILALVSVAIAFLIVLNEIAALILVRGTEFLSVFAKPQRDALAMLFLWLHGQGFVINGIFWGLWLVPFGLLVIRSGFFPRILGILLIVNCLAYLAASLTSLLLPDYASVVSRVTQPALTGEVWIMFWLLIRGANTPRLVPATP